MVGERDHREQQDAVRWEQLDDAAISIPPPFNSTYNGALHHNNRSHQHQQYAAAMLNSEDMQSHWDDEQMGLMGDSMVGCNIPSMEKGVRFPISSPTHAGYNNNNVNNTNGQLSQAPLQRAHSRYRNCLSHEIINSSLNIDR